LADSGPGLVIQTSLPVVPLPTFQPVVPLPTSWSLTISLLLFDTNRLVFAFIFHCILFWMLVNCVC